MSFASRCATTSADSAADSFEFPTRAREYIEYTRALRKRNTNFCGRNSARLHIISCCTIRGGLKMRTVSHRVERALSTGLSSVIAVYQNIPIEFISRCRCAIDRVAPPDNYIARLDKPSGFCPICRGTTALRDKGNWTLFRDELAWFAVYAKVIIRNSLNARDRYWIAECCCADWNSFWLAIPRL